MTSNRATLAFGVIVLCAVCIGAQEVRSINPIDTIDLDSRNPVVLGIELCGPTYSALKLIGPKNEDGSLDADSIVAVRQRPGMWVYRYLIPPPLELSISGYRAAEITVGEYHGRVSFVGVNWRGNKKQTRRIWKALDRSITALTGPPFGVGPKSQDWKMGDLQVATYREQKHRFVGVAFICKPALEETATLLRMAGKTGGNGMDLLTMEISDLDFPPAQTITFGSSLIAAIQAYGEPWATPCYSGPDLQMVQFTSVDGVFGPTTTHSLYLIDGEVVKIVAGSMPITNPEENADTVFDYLVKRNKKQFGNPFESWEDPGGVDRYAAWNGDNKLLSEARITTNHDMTMAAAVLFDLTQEQRFAGEMTIGPRDGDPWCESVVIANGSAASDAEAGESARRLD